MSKDNEHAIATKPLEVRPYDILRYQVRSETNARVFHIVDLLTLECSCWHFQFRLAGSGKMCKHAKAALRFFALEMLTQIRAIQKQKNIYPHHD